MTWCLQFDGVTSYWHTPYFIDLINSGSVILPDLDIPVPERFVEPSVRHHLYVPGSERGVVSVVGEFVTTSTCLAPSAASPQ